MRRLAWLSIAYILLAITPAHVQSVWFGEDDAAQTPSMSWHLSAPPTLDREQPDDPPGQAAKHNPYARSPVRHARSGSFVSVQVNVDEFGENIMGDAANEPSIAIDPNDPNRIAIGWRQFDTINSNFRQAGWSYSVDAGQTWTFPGVLEPGQFRSDPVLASDADGNFYYSSLSSLDSIEVFKSTDGGVTWPTVADAFGGDKQWIAVDRTSGIGTGHVYQIWNAQFSCCPPNDFTRSTNRAASFESPVQASLPSMKWGTMDVGPDGTLYLAGSTLTQGGHLFTQSTNAQDAKQTPTFAAVEPIDLGGQTSSGAPPNPAGLQGQVWIATDHSAGQTQGNVYVLASVDPPGSDPLDVMFIRSTDGGQTWSPPLRINDDSPGTNAWQWFGTMSVAPNGRIDVIWNDTRTSGAANLSELFYSSSTDGGLTWSTNIPVSPMFDSHLGWPSQSKIGDYYHMVSDNASASLAYAATFNGEQDVYFLRLIADCNDNGISDDIDIDNRTSEDCNDNSIPDECEPDNDCNTNDIQDICDIANGTSADCNNNNIPDECIDQETDCNSNLAPDECDIADGTSDDCIFAHDCCEVGHGSGCSDPQIEACVCAWDAFCCTVDWDIVCAGQVETLGCGSCSQSGNGVPDECDIADGSSQDCNDNGVPDECDIAEGTSEDDDADGVPDECGCPADFDNSGDVEAFDLAELLGSWGPCVGCFADLDNDDDVDAADLAQLLGDWGLCPL